MTESELPTFHIPTGTCVPPAQVTPKPMVSLDSPALLVMTDLTEVRAATVDPDATLPNAEQLMIHQGVRLLFVVRDFPCVEGLVTTTDIWGDRPMRVVEQRQIRHDEVTVADVMSELSSLDAIDYDVLSQATVSQVAATFRKFGRSHLLVLQAATSTSPARIRGVLSMTQLERQLGHPIGSTEIADTFSAVQRVLA